MNAIEITTVIGCRNRCDYCPQDKLVGTYRETGGVTTMTLEMFQRVLSKIPAGTQIDFSGMVELNPHCTEMILCAHEKGYEIAVFTTAVGMRAVDVEKIESIPFHHFVVHLPDTERYSKIEIDETYMETLDAIVKSRIRNMALMTASSGRQESHRQIHQAYEDDSSGRKSDGHEGRSSTRRLARPIRCREPQCPAAQWGCCACAAWIMGCSTSSGH